MASSSLIRPVPVPSQATSPPASRAAARQAATRIRPGFPAWNRPYSRSFIWPLAPPKRVEKGMVPWAWAERSSSSAYRRRWAGSPPRSTAWSQHRSRFRPASRPIHHTSGLNQWTAAQTSIRPL